AAGGLPDAHPRHPDQLSAGLARRAAVHRGRVGRREPHHDRGERPARRGLPAGRPLPAAGRLSRLVLVVGTRTAPAGGRRAPRAGVRPTDPVHRAIKVSRGEKHPAEFARLRRAAAAAGVTLLDRLLPRGEVLALLATCDAYVSRHRSEGFGFTMAEAMLLGKPTLATAYSGNLDFMTADNGFLVDYDRVTIAEDLPPYPRGGVWAEPSVAHAAELMRRVVDRPAEAR